MEIPERFPDSYMITGRGRQTYPYTRRPRLDAGRLIDRRKVAEGQGVCKAKRPAGGKSDRGL